MEKALETLSYIPYFSLLRLVVAAPGGKMDHDEIFLRDFEETRPRYEAFLSNNREKGEVVFYIIIVLFCVIFTAVILSIMRTLYRVFVLKQPLYMAVSLHTLI